MKCMTAAEFIKKKKIIRSKAGWREVEGKPFFFRSKWEANYARYLSFLKKHQEIVDWEHEPKTFWYENIRRGVRSFLPDFKVIHRDNTHHWVEVKGYMDARSHTKLKRFKKYYPEEKIELIEKEWFSLNNRKLRPIIQEWE